MDKKIIGRQYEQKQLARAFESEEAELIAVYGRRRVGKTFLIRRFFEHKDCYYFQATGIYGAPIGLQLKEFKEEIERTFYGQIKGPSLKDPANWMEALGMLTDAIQIFGEQKTVVLFFDEFPWMATHKSGLLQALDYYWNRFWVNDDRIKVIICGSAASWIIDNILNNRGGLHNRVTLRIHLDPFSLYETQAYLKSRGVRVNRQQVLDLYMCIGGIPFYLKYVEKGLSAAQNINQLCFQAKGTLLDEFKNLFSSLFDNGTVHEEIIRFIASKREGMDRSEIEKLTGTKGGRLSSRLKELEEAGFVSSFVPWGRERGVYYKVIDEYSLFYLCWIAPRTKGRLAKEETSRYWDSVVQTSAWKAWAGYAFEAVCYKHITNIRAALQIPDGATATSWRHLSKRGYEDGAQIDLLFDRPDGIVNICEIKHCKDPYAIDKNYAKDLQRKAEVYRKSTKTEKQLFFSMITANRLKKTMYSEELISSAINLEDLFKPRNSL